MVNIVLLSAVMCRYTECHCAKCRGAFRLTKTCGLYYKIFMILIYDRNAIGQYYETTIVDYDRS
jgi:hypothetical protein